MGDEDRAEQERLLRAAVLAGDERAWRTWYDVSFDLLHAYVAWRCAGRSDWIDEVVQDTWLTAVRRLRAFDPVRGGFAQWLCGIAANLLRNRLRRHCANPLRPEVSSNGCHAEGVARPAREDDSGRVARTLDLLPDRYEAVLRAKYLDQQSVVQIAQGWNETPKAIESLLTRARQAFRDTYRRLEES